MPPIVIDPPNNGATQTNSYYFINANAHGTHLPISITRWKVTVTTGQSNGGTLITETAWSNAPITGCTLNNLPANNQYYWAQLIYEKTSGGQWVSTSNKFQSQP